MKCPKCKVELSKGNTTKELDVTEYTVFRCPRCRKKFTDIKIPYDAIPRNETSL